MSPRPNVVAGAVAVCVLPMIAAAQGGGARPVTRSISLSVDETWTDNVQFRDEAARDSVTRVGARAELRRTRPRGELSLSADAAAARHAETAELDHLFYGGRLTLSRQLSRRTSLRLEEGYREAYAGDQRSLTELAALDPLSRSRMHDAVADLARQVSRQATAGVAARHTYVDFDQPDAADGHRLTVQARVDREVSRHGRLRFHADREWSWLDEAEGVSRTGLSWSSRMGIARVEAGAGALGVDRASDLDVQPFGMASLGLEGERGALALRYERSVGAAFGVGGLQAMDYFIARGTWRPWRHVQADVEAFRAVSRTSGSDDLLASMDQAQASLRYTLGARVTLGTTCQWRRRESGRSSVRPEASALLVSVGYSQDWR